MEKSGPIHFGRSYSLGEEYESIRTNAGKYLKKRLDHSDVIAFDEVDRSVRYTTECLIPARATRRPHILLLFSNPHPNSIQQGMFLSANTKGRESTFWSTMRKAGWFSVPEPERDPKHLRDYFFQVKYDSPFAFSFYCYYAFPTGYPDQIRKIFGKSFFDQNIETEAETEFKRIVEQTDIKAIVTFNKVIFNHVAREKISKYIAVLNKGKVVRGRIKNPDRDIPIFLTYPTGWRYHSDYLRLRKRNLEKVRKVICEELGIGDNP